MLDKRRGYWHSAELLTAARMAEAGWVVSVPLIPVRYDLIGDWNGKLMRVQVKRAKWREQKTKPQGLGDRAGWTVTLSHRKNNGNGGLKHVRLAQSEFDYLSVMCTSEDLYFIPVAALLTENGTFIKTFRIKPPDPTNTRADATESGARYELYRNNFALAE